MDSKNRFEQRCCLCQFLLIIGLSSAMITYFWNVKSNGGERIERIHEDNFSEALRVTGTILLVVSSLTLVLGFGQLLVKHFFWNSKYPDDIEEQASLASEDEWILSNRSESILSFTVASELESNENLNCDWMKEYDLREDPPPKYEDIMKISTAVVVSNFPSSRIVNI